MSFNIPESSKLRVVILGAGFAGFKFAQKLDKRKFQIVLIDKNNYFQFQPLFYQVAMSGLEPSSICFPIRKNFRNIVDFFVRVAEIQKIDYDLKIIESSSGYLKYDKLVIATGSKTNYYNNPNFEKYTIPLKSVSESLYLRNAILEDLEHAVLAEVESAKQLLLDIIIIGGGPTGVELAGALSEMKAHILPKDYPDLNSNKMNIHLVQGADRLLDTMDLRASKNAYTTLLKMGVNIYLNKKVIDIEHNTVFLSNGQILKGHKIIWAAGVIGSNLEGIPTALKGPGNRIQVNEFMEVESIDNLYAIGDIAYLCTAKFPTGLPSLAPVALQQANYLSKYFNNNANTRTKPFKYIDKGSMATIGRSKAVLNFKSIFLSGFTAWIAWLFIHLYYLIGVRNKLIVFINWVWNYTFYDQALRINIKPKTP